MNHDRRWLVPLALTFALAACSQPAADADAAPAAADTANASTTADAAADTGDDAPTPAADDGDYELTMDKVDAYFATIVKIAQATQADPSLAGDDESGEGDRISMDASESVEAYIARLEADPVAKRLVTSAGMSVSDFAHTNSAMLEGMMAAAMLEATGKTTLPEGINPQYVAFAQAHKDELAAKAEAMQARLGAGDED